ncbi:MAG: HAMP domain-containing histidine kinase [Ktedonobacterales bacterium]|nr:HAMP domain-containing histidine kinase [Ktedonobacterales bacterium]
MNLPNRVIQTIRSVCNKIPALWLSAHPLRASFEGLLIGGVGAWIGALMTADDRARSIEKVSTFEVMVFIYWALFTILWCALRARFYGNWWQGIVIDILAGIGLAILPTTLFLCYLSRVPALFFPMSIVYGACMMIGYPSLHGLLRLWIASRRQLQWALTSVQLLAALCSVVVFILVITVVEMLFDPGGLGPTPVVSYILLDIFILALSGIFLMTMLPFWILISYLFMRPIARRIQQLVDATSAIRAGKYHIRIPVAGKNEIAQLQADFNSMASDLERYVQEVRDERDTVAKLLQNRRQLIASVGHELRTPVATLRGYLESLRAHQAELSPETLEHDMDVMEHEAIRLQTLIEDLFTLSQSEVGSLILHCQPSDIASIIHTVGDTVAPLAWKNSRVEVVIEPSSGLPLVWVDTHRVTQVILNLVHNAIRHTPPGGLVVINTIRKHDTVAIQVRDTGEGIAPDELPHIWERFYRGKATGNRLTNGAGLGLALVKELTEAMGGSVAVESFEGIGSCFTISLSLASRIDSPER